MFVGLGSGVAAPGRNGELAFSSPSACHWLVGAGERGHFPQNGLATQESARCCLAYSQSYHQAFTWIIILQGGLGAQPRAETV